MLRTLRPRLERSLADNPERAAAILTWAWARIPDLLGEAIDLRDTERVAAIVAIVERRELGADPDGEPAPVGDA